MSIIHSNRRGEYNDLIHQHRHSQAVDEIQNLSTMSMKEKNKVVVEKYYWKKKIKNWNQLWSLFVLSFIFFSVVLDCLLLLNIIFSVAVIIITATAATINIPFATNAVISILRSTAAAVWINMRECSFQFFFFANGLIIFQLWLAWSQLNSWCNWTDESDWHANYDHFRKGKNSVASFILCVSH